MLLTASVMDVEWLLKWMSISLEAIPSLWPSLRVSSLVKAEHNSSILASVNSLSWGTCCEQNAKSLSKCINWNVITRTCLFLVVYPMQMFSFTKGNKGHNFVPSLDLLMAIPKGYPRGRPNNFRNSV